MSERQHAVKKLSILLPVFNEGESLKIMVQILKATLEVSNEVLIIYDSLDDTSIPTARWLEDRYANIRPVFNAYGRGVPNAIKAGVEASEGDVILIALVDEVFPIARIEEMLFLIRHGCDLVSATRYGLGGRRLGGSWIGHVCSRTANVVFRRVTGFVMSDATTGMKMIKKSVFKRIPIEAGAVGWAFSFELAIKAQFYGLRLGEVPVVSVDRIFGGDSTFRLGAWAREYFRWFCWGVKYLKKGKAPGKVYIPGKYRRYARGRHYAIIDHRQ